MLLEIPRMVLKSARSGLDIYPGYFIGLRRRIKILMNIRTGSSFSFYKEVEQ